MAVPGQEHWELVQRECCGAYQDYSSMGVGADSSVAGRGRLDDRGKDSG